MTEKKPIPKLRNGDMQTRSGFAGTITVLSKQFYQSVLVDNPNTYEVISNSILTSNPMLEFVMGKDLALAKSLGEDSRLAEGKIKDRVELLPIEEVVSGQTILNEFIDMANADIPFRTAQRLKPYLPIVLPDTREGLLILKEICLKVRKQIAQETVRPNLTENLKSLFQVLGELEDEFVTRTLEDKVLQANIFESARSQARIQLTDAIQKDDAEYVDGLKIEIAQGKLTRLKDIKAKEIIDGEERIFSQLDNELNKIIQEENLEDRMNEGKENLSQIIEQRKTEVLETIVKRRGGKRIAGLMLLDRTLLEMAAKISGKTEEEILAKNDEGIKIRTNIASQLIDAPKRKLSRLGFTVFPNFDQVFEEERQKLTQAIELGDPLLFVAQLSSEEFEIIRKIIPNIFKRKVTADNRALFTLAKETLQKKLATEASENELIELMAEKLFTTFIKRLSQEMIDQAVISFNIDPQGLIDDPLSLFSIAEEIITTAQKNTEQHILQLTLAAEQTLQFVNLDSLVDEVRFIPAIEKRSEELARTFETSTIDPDPKRLGPAVVKKDISSTEGPFRYFPEYKTRYPDVVVQALVNLYEEYNQSFGPIVAANAEWGSDYQYCLTGPGRSPNNYFVQIDMAGLSDRYLETASSLSVGQVQEDLRGRIFEIENSIAMYQLLIKIFSSPDQPSNFDLMFRESLEDIRRLFERPIALLAVTDEKDKAMKGSEFGKQADDPLTDNEVKNLSGFDRFFGPDEFNQYLQQSGGECDYLLFVRSSDPIEKLKDPSLVIDQPLLSNPDIRRIIKANTLTLNIDSPDWPINSTRRINDTKAYLLSMGMAFPIYSFADFKSPDLELFLQSQGGGQAEIELNELLIRAKPMLSSYGCYNHFRGSLSEPEFKNNILKSLRKRGPYILQPEIKNASIINESDGKKHVFIDRNFFSIVNGVTRFLGGERTLMLANSNEAVRGRIHGNESTITAEVF